MNIHLSGKNRTECAYENKWKSDLQSLDLKHLRNHFSFFSDDLSSEYLVNKFKSMMYKVHELN